MFKLLGVLDHICCSSWERVLNAAAIIVTCHSDHLGTQKQAEDDTVTGSMLTLLRQMCQHH